MRTLAILALCFCHAGFNEKVVNAKGQLPVDPSELNPHLGISKTYLDEIKKRNGTILIDAIIQPDERMDVPQTAGIRRIGICVDQHSDYSRCKGFVSLTGTDGARLAADGLSEYRMNDGELISASFVLVNEGREPRRAVVFASKAE